LDIFYFKRISFVLKNFVFFSLAFLFDDSSFRNEQKFRYSEVPFTNGLLRSPQIGKWRCALSPKDFLHPHWLKLFLEHSIFWE